PSSFSSSSTAAPFKAAADNVMHLGDGAVEVIADHPVLILAGPGEFAPGHVQAALNGRLVLRAAAAQPLFQHFRRRRFQKDRDGVGTRLADAGGPLHVDDQDDAGALLPVRLHLGPQGAVEVAVHLGPFEEAAQPALALEPAAVPEMVADAR